MIIKFWVGSGLKFVPVIVRSVLPLTLPTYGVILETLKINVKLLDPAVYSDE
jgi:hypothetical protein